ncbi:MAG: aminomethyl-transferring glycine dehydrogenase subunit GcvPB, partial [Hyphomicrobiaceae bacterium]
MSTGMNRTGRPTQPAAAPSAASQGATFSGHRGLDHEEPLLFERGRLDKSGVDFPEAPLHRPRLGGLERDAEIGLPGLDEPEAMRHYVRLS